jgi:hypothetical protein
MTPKNKVFRLLELVYVLKQNKECSTQIEFTTSTEGVYVIRWALENGKSEKIYYKYFYLDSNLSGYTFEEIEEDLEKFIAEEISVLVEGGERQ